MKKLIVFVLSFLVIFNFCGCKNNNSSNLSEIIAYNLSQIETIDNLSDETIKALSVLCRTKINQSKTSDFDKSKINEKVLSLVKETENEKFSSSKLSDIYYYFSSGDWNKTIKKSEILENLSNQNIYLSSISKITPINENNKTVSFDINEKIITFETMNKFCKFKSNLVISTKISDNDITFYGSGIGIIGEGLNIEKSETLAKNGKNYTEILSNFDKYGQIF